MFKLRHAPPSLWQRWFINGEVPCFTGPHLPLALLAMAVLLLCFLLIPLTTIISLDILKVHAHSVHSHLSVWYVKRENTSVSNVHIVISRWRMQSKSLDLASVKTTWVLSFLCRSRNGWDTLFLHWLQSSGRRWNGGVVWSLEGGSCSCCSSSPSQEMQ